nr:hypothetical protein [Tanacetum cinerariifolium]
MQGVKGVDIRLMDCIVKDVLFLQKKLEEDLVTYFQGFQNTSKSFDDSTNVVNIPLEQFVVKIICGLNKAPDSPHLHTFSPNQFHCFHCKDALKDGKACQRCTCKRCGSGLSKGLCLICENNHNSLNDSPSISSKFSHNPTHIDERCFECGDALDGIFCQQCTCKSCGKCAHIGYTCLPKVPIISNSEPCNQTMNNEPPQTLLSFDSTCYSDKEISVPCVSKPNFVDESSNIFNPPPQPPIYSCEFCESNAQYGHYCTPQSPVIHPPPQETSIEILHDQEKVINAVQTFLRKFNRYSFFKTPMVLLLAWDRVFKTKDAFRNEQYKPEDVQELFHKLLNDVQNVHDELAEYINTPSWNRPTFYNNGDDDDVDYTIAITPVLSTKEPNNSLSMGDEHLDTIPATKSDEVIKSGVEDLLPIPTKDHFEIVINSNDDYSSSDDDSLYYENIEYVEASPQDSEFVRLEVEKIVILKDKEIDDDNLCEKLLKFPPTDRSNFTHEEFGDEPAHIISLPEYDCFYFRDLPDPGELISSLNSGIRENLYSTTCGNLPVEDDHSPFLAHVNTLVEYMILSGDRPPMLEKDLYDLWKSRMELYMKNREHGRMILESVEMVHSFGLLLKRMERECKLYDAFDKFTYIKRETLYKYYLRFTQLINDMNIHNIRIKQFQVNTKFLNSLSPEWSKFVTDVKLAKDLHTTNFNQLHAYLEQHELHANEVRLLGERGDVTARVILFGTIPIAIPATVPIVDPPVVFDDTTLIPTNTPTITPVVSTLPHTFLFMYTDSSDIDTFERPQSHMKLLLLGEQAD